MMPQYVLYSYGAAKPKQRYQNIENTNYIVVVHSEIRVELNANVFVFFIRSVATASLWPAVGICLVY